MEHCHGEKTSRWVRSEASQKAQLHLTVSILPHNKFGWLFGLVE
jgi:hypothetical protein